MWIKFFLGLPSIRMLVAQCTMENAIWFLFVLFVFIFILTFYKLNYSNLKLAMQYFPNNWSHKERTIMYDVLMKT